MNWIIYLFGSGAVFFLGIGLVLVGATIFTVHRRRWMVDLASLFALLGLLLVVLSATPLPYWIYALGTATTLVWLSAERRTGGALFDWRKVLRLLLVAVWLTTVAIELPFHLPSTLNTTGSPTLYIIGDSVSAGMGSDAETWPQLLANSRPVEVVNLAQMGATASTAFEQAKSLPSEGGLVLVEIGGNDLLGSNSATVFEHDLDRLLTSVCKPGRTVLMFELPLPPFCNEFGRAQRRLSAKYGVTLVPKRTFVGVLTEDEATVDSVHLSQKGHERMAETVWGLIRPAYPE